MRKAVNVRKMEITQTIVNEALIRNGKLPEGALVYGVYRKTGAEFVHVKT